MLRDAALSILLLAILLLVGCGRTREAQQAVQAGRQLQQTGETTIKTDEGEVQIKTDKAGEQATITVEGESGEKHSVTVGADLDTSELSLAIYPGATGEQSQITTDDQGKQLHFTFTTTDSFDKIADFYKSKYPNADADAFAKEMSGRRILNISLRGAPILRSITLIQDEFCDEDEVIIVLSQTEWTAW